jgi:hypothetical protein
MQHKCYFWAVSCGLYWVAATNQRATNAHGRTEAINYEKWRQLHLNVRTRGTYMSPHLVGPHNGKINSWSALGRLYKPSDTIRGSNLTPEDVISVASTRHRSRLPPLLSQIQHSRVQHAKFLKIYCVFSNGLFKDTFNSSAPNAGITGEM